MASSQLSSATKEIVHLVRLTLEQLVSSMSARALLAKRCWQKCATEIVANQRLKTYYVLMTIAIQLKQHLLVSEACRVQEVTVDMIKEFRSARRTVAHSPQQKALASLRELQISMVQSCHVALIRSSAPVRFVPALIQTSLSRLISSTRRKMVRWNVTVEDVACSTMIMINSAIMMMFSKLVQHLPNGTNRMS